MYGMSGQNPMGTMFMNNAMFGKKAGTNMAMMSMMEQPQYGSQGSYGSQGHHGQSRRHSGYGSQEGYGSQGAQQAQQEARQGSQNMQEGTMLAAMGGKKGAELGNSLMVQGQMQQNISQVNRQISNLQGKLLNENHWTSRQLNSTTQSAITSLTPQQQQAIKFYNLNIAVLKNLNPSPLQNGRITPTNKNKSSFLIMGNFTKAIKVGVCIVNGKSIDIFLKNDGWFSDNSNYNYDISTNLNLNNDTSVYYSQPVNINTIGPNPHPSQNGHVCFQLTALANSAEGTPFYLRTAKMISDLQGQKGTNQFIQGLAWWAQGGGSKSKKSKKPATKKPVSKKPATKKPVSKKPATKKPLSKKPATKKPVSKKLVSKKPKTKKTPAKK